MAQIIASHYDAIDTLASAMSRFKQHMLEYYAKEIGLEATREWDKYSDHIVVECSEKQALDLLCTLTRKGCTDLHLYSDDPITRKMAEDRFFGHPWICEGKWKL